MNWFPDEEMEIFNGWNWRPVTVLGELPSQLRLRWPVKEVGARVAEVAQLEKKRVHLPKSRPEHKEATIGDSLPMARSLLARRIFLLRIGLKWIVLLPLVCVLPFGRSSFFFFFLIFIFFFFTWRMCKTRVARPAHTLPNCFLFYLWKLGSYSYELVFSYLLIVWFITFQEWCIVGWSSLFSVWTMIGFVVSMASFSLWIEIVSYFISGDLLRIHTYSFLVTYWLFDLLFSRMIHRRFERVLNLLFCWQVFLFAASESIH